MDRNSDDHFIPNDKDFRDQNKLSPPYVPPFSFVQKLTQFKMFMLSPGKIGPTFLFYPFPRVFRLIHTTLSLNNYSAVKGHMIFGFCYVNTCYVVKDSIKKRLERPPLGLSLVD